MANPPPTDDSQRTHNRPPPSPKPSTPQTQTPEQPPASQISLPLPLETPHENDPPAKQPRATRPVSPTPAQSHQEASSNTGARPRTDTSSARASSSAPAFAGMELTALDLEKIGAIPATRRINRPLVELKTLRKTLQLMVRVFSLALLMFGGILAGGAWLLWQKVTNATTLARNLKDNTEARFSDLQNRITHLQSSTEKGPPAQQPNDQPLKEIQSNLNLINETLVDLTVRLDELESTLNTKLQTLESGRQEIQNAKNELEQLRADFTNQQNRTASDLSTLLRRLERMERFLVGTAQSDEQKKNTERRSEP